jgi:Protein of unknown function (DUF3570)
MQLNAPRAISTRAQLAAATVTLLGVASPPARAVEATSSALLYAESNRVTVFETRADFRHQLVGDKVAGFHVTIDALTGASPNGALQARVPQTFTRPSGGGEYTIAAGQEVLDPTFKDTRVAGGADLDFPMGRLTRGDVSVSLSYELDYLSAGGSFKVSRDLFDRNTTVSVGLSGSVDNVRALGGTPVALTSMAPPDPSPFLREDGEEGGGEQGSEVKTLTDGLIGVTQILDRNTWLQLNYAVSRASGYLTDPYKLITVIQGAGDASPGDPVDYLYEKRPDVRLKQALYAETKHTFGRDVADVSYRYLWDDWGVRSHTVDGSYRLEIGERMSFAPEVRYYTQTAADFWMHSLLQGDVPTHATADTRLGQFHAWTYALKVNRRTAGGHDVGVRVGAYVQAGESHPSDAIGSQVGLDLFPKVTAIISQVSTSFEFW